MKRWVELKARMGTIWKETEKLEQQIQVLKLQLMTHSKRPLNSLIDGSRIRREDADFINESAPYLQAANYIPSEVRVSMSESRKSLYTDRESAISKR